MTCLTPSAPLFFLPVVTLCDIVHGRASGWDTLMYNVHACRALMIPCLDTYTGIVSRAIQVHVEGQKSVYGDYRQVSVCNECAILCLWRHTAQLLMLELSRMYPLSSLSSLVVAIRSSPPRHE